MSNENLTAELCHDTWTVADESGGRWWPNEESERLIAAAEDQAAEAIRLCQDVNAGDWSN